MPISSACVLISSRPKAVTITILGICCRRSLRLMMRLACSRSNPEPGSEMEGAACARLALSPDGALHHLDQALGDRESKPGAAILPRGRSVCLRECLEQRRALLGRHADTTVPHGEPHLHPVRQLLLQ